jgi:DNA-binding beta-propeller fold protein YncE
VPTDETQDPLDSPDTTEVASEVVPESAPVMIAGAYAARSRRRKVIILVLLVLLLALLAYSAAYFEANRRLPLPRLTPDTQALEPPQYLFSIAGEGKDALTTPIGVGVGSNNRVYVIDFGAQSVKAFTTNGAFLFSFKKLADGANTTLKNPVHLAVDKNNDVWVTDRRLHAVYVFDADGKYKRRFSPNGDPTFPWLPLGLWLDSNGDAYFTDVPSVPIHRVSVLAADGTVKTMFGRGGQVDDPRAGEVEFSFPNGLLLGPGKGDKRDLFVTDSNNRRIQVFSPSGAFRRFILTEGTPRGIAIDSKSRLYVADVLSHRVDIFNLQGKRLTTFGEAGMGPGQFQYPEDIALDGRGRIYISDRENDQVQVWGYPTLEIPGVTKIAPGRWGWCLAPFPLLLIPLLMRRRRFVVTADFVEAMILAELVRTMTGRRWRWIVTEETHPQFVDRVVDGVDLGQLLEPEPYSHSDASALSAKLGIPMERAAILALAQRHKTFCTEDPELARLAVLLNIDVYDRQAFIERFVSRKR